MTTTKNGVFIVITWKLLFYARGKRGIDFWWEGIFLGGGMISKFLAGGEKIPAWAEVLSLEP